MADQSSADELTMALEPGMRFGAFEIAESIGAGGMGVVFRATDTKLKRDVAIKALPESLANDAERLARFQREAELLASLNHPNIAQIYGLEEAGGSTALILELVDGPTLADRIEQGAIPADEALGIAMQITDALEVAHAKNIVHRDLKPANIKLRADGTVKVLDFGIAKALEPDALTSEPVSPMVTTPATQVGVILGTAQYMSPEQAKGKPVDQRADIWAFGCVLYEMLTGQPAFGGEDVPTTLARVLEREIDLSSAPATVPASVRQTISMCLRKDVGKRIADMRDVRLILADEFDMPMTRAESLEIVGSWRRSLPIAATLVITAGVAGLAAWVLWPEDVDAPVNRFAHDLPPGQLLRATDRSVIALSPDGRHFVYNTVDGLFLRRMDALEAQLIPGTELALYSPAFSPDGQSVAYWEGRLLRVSVSGGAPTFIADELGIPNGISWEADGTILIGQPDGIYRVPATGGALEKVISQATGPQFGARLLPDGDTVIFNEMTTGFGWDSSEIVARSLSTGERVVLFSGGADARYVPTGHLVYAFEDGLYARAFDLNTLTVSGEAVPLAQGLMRSVGTGAANYAIAHDGTLVYVMGGSGVLAQRALVWVDRDGVEEQISAPPRAYVSPRISPDGTRIALNTRDDEFDIWVWDIVREIPTRLTFGTGQDRFPVWSPDGSRIAYSAQPGALGLGQAGTTTLMWQAADGAGSPQELAGSSGQIFPTAFLPDGRGILAYGGPNDTASVQNDDISIVYLDDASEPMPLLATEFQESVPEISPDGRWLAYVSNESGQTEVYVRPFPDIETNRWQISRSGGAEPLWSRDGTELFYRNDEALFAVPVQTDPVFVAGSPMPLFEGQFYDGQGGRAYDVSPDGERFLMIKEIASSAAQTRIVIVENWFEELERLVPTD